MMENIGRKVTLVVVVLLVSIGCMVVPDSPFRMGLDLRGGTRLVYRFDFDRALADGSITREEYDNKPQLLADFIGIIRTRIDPDGLLEAGIRAQGSTRVEIELPGSADLSANEASAPLLEEIQAGTSSLTLDLADDEELAKFPATGGILQIESEKLRYDSRDGATFIGLQRGQQGTQRSAHAAGQEVDLVGDDEIRRKIENTGQLQFRIVATPDSPVWRQRGTDFQEEQKLVQQWRTDNPGVDLTEFNRLKRDEGGPPAGIHWYPYPETGGIMAVVDPDNPDWLFSGDNLDLVRPSIDDLGFNAVFFKFRTSKTRAFGDFTETNKGKLMAIVLNDEIASAPRINSKLPGEGIITGGERGFSQKERDELITILRSGSLRIKPELEYEERVGATLGERQIKRGEISSLLGLLCVLAFTIAYYRRLGVFAGISLVANLVILMGALAFFQATLTLPGIAGIILTVGMAVDANILIFERIREELQRGSKVLQASKNGFEKALSTIVDANLTTLITAFILYYIGTGPVAGFATTLIIGILSSMFCALVLTRVLVAWDIARGTKTFNMMQFVTKTKYPFMSKAKVAITSSLLVIIAGVTLFVLIPDKDKLGIDFLGGFTVTVRTEDPHGVQEVKNLIAEIPGTVGKAEVKPILNSASGDGYTSFRITGKMSGAMEEGADQGEQTTAVDEIRSTLAPVLTQGPIDLEVGEDETSVSGRLYFESVHPPEDVAAALGELGLQDPTVEAVPDRPDIISFSGTTVSPRTASTWRESLAKAFRDRSDSRREKFQLAENVSEVRIVGAQVVGELRDQAILAIVLSLFAAVLYIRARFAEYSYGLAAVIAIVHDVLVVLGTLALFDEIGVIDSEITLPMIAAFLTIIGYSLNDTIVVFDRVRENLPRMKVSFTEVLDVSINQTLSRTLLTSGTTLIAIVILLAFNLGSRSVLEGFAFAMAVGVIVGTYSSIFIASPVLLWLEQRSERAEGKGEAEAKAKPAKAGAGA